MTTGNSDGIKIKKGGQRKGKEEDINRNRQAIMKRDKHSTDEKNEELKGGKE